MTPDLASLLTVVIAAVVALRIRPRVLDGRLGRVADSWPLPSFAGVVTAAAVWHIFGGLDPTPYIQDEAAYLLQARLFAAGQLAGPPAPHPEFFEQFHVFVTPVTAAKYPPGWPLALVPGIWLGAPALIPILLSGLTAALLVILVRRVADAATAVLAWALWLPTPMEGRFRGTFLSEHLTGALWLAAWWALWRWLDDGRTRWLAVVSVAIAWQGITRPFTAIAFAIPVAIVVMVRVVRTRAWRQLALALLPGLALCLLFFVHNRAVTGRWGTFPMSHYSTLVAPWDTPGFGVDTTPPLLAETPDQAHYRRSFLPHHAVHTPDRLPQILRDRVRSIVGNASATWGFTAFAIALLLGAIGATPALRFALASVVLAILAYLIFAHPPHWVVYYQEGHAALAAAAAVGVTSLFRWLQRAVRVDGALAERRVAATALVALVALTALPGGIALARGARARTAFPHELVREVARCLPAPAVLFIRYAPDHHMDRAFVENPPFHEQLPVWRVRDLGARNAILLQDAPARRPFLYDEGAGTVIALQTDGVRGRSGPPLIRGLPTALPRPGEPLPVLGDFCPRG